MRKNILCMVGTRPECIKMAPVIRSLRETMWADVTIASTGQHRELVYQTLALFGLKPDIDLDVMVPDQTLAELSGRIFLNFDLILQRNEYDLVVVQGDTTSVMIAAIASFYRNIPVAHVEAGLRTNDLKMPFPEELNRKIASLVADLHFAPSNNSSQNLLTEKIPNDRVYVTGNTVIDALRHVAEQDLACDYPQNPSNRLVLVTAHRRENFGEPLQRICEAVRRLHDEYVDVEFAYPVHPNPNVRGPVHAFLGDLDRVYLIPPADYTQLVALMKNSYFVLTDSGGIQEEAPALAKPVLVMRSETERPEAVEFGVAKLVGTQTQTILEESRRLLDDSEFYRSLARGASPYGDGRASERIVQHIDRYLNGPG